MNLFTWAIVIYFIGVWIGVFMVDLENKEVSERVGIIFPILLWPWILLSVIVGMIFVGPPWLIKKAIKYFSKKGEVK